MFNYHELGSVPSAAKTTINQNPNTKNLPTVIEMKHSLERFSNRFEQEKESVNLKIDKLR